MKGKVNTIENTQNLSLIIFIKLQKIKLIKQNSEFTAGKIRHQRAQNMLKGNKI